MSDKKKMIIALLLDESGSMAGNKKPALAAINEYITTIRNDYETTPELGEVFLSFITFSSGYTKGAADKVKFVYNLRNITEVENIPDDAYKPAGGTPLLEAIGRTIEALDGFEGTQPEPAANPLTAFLGASTAEEAKIVMVVQTDGEETDWNPEYKKEKIATMIKEREDKGNWTFVFLGAGIDAIEEGMNLGLGAKSSYAFTGAASGVGSYGSTYKAASRATSMLRGGSSLSVKNFAEVMKVAEEEQNKNEKNS